MRCTDRPPSRWSSGKSINQLWSAFLISNPRRSHRPSHTLSQPLIIIALAEPSLLMSITLSIVSSSSASCHQHSGDRATAPLPVITPQDLPLSSNPCFLPIVHIVAHLIYSEVSLKTRTFTPRRTRIQPLAPTLGHDDCSPLPFENKDCMVSLSRETATSLTRPTWRSPCRYAYRVFVQSQANEPMDWCTPQLWPY